MNPFCNDGGASNSGDSGSNGSDSGTTLADAGATTPPWDTGPDAVSSVGAYTVHRLAGNGVVMPAAWPPGSNLQVIVLENGQPTAGIKVHWAVTAVTFEADQYIWVTNVDGNQDSTTDSTGMAEAWPRSGNPLDSWGTAKVTASLPNGAAVDFYVTTVFIPPGQIAGNPSLYLVQPSTSSLTGRRGTVAARAVQVQSAALWGPEGGHGIPLLGVRILGPNGELAAPVSCVGTTVLTGADGAGYCDVSFDGPPGTYAVRVETGWASFNGLSVTITP
jgi:hypothetical protein